MYRLSELKRLAEIYIAATGENPNGISNRISGGSNNRLIGRLLDGLGISGESIDAASEFFDCHWPQKVAWPKGIVRNGALREPSEAAK